MRRTTGYLLAATALATTVAAGAALAQQDAPPREPTPAFEGQTDAPPPATPSQYEVQPVAIGLQTAFSFALLPDGNFLVAERTGTLRLVRQDGWISMPVAGAPGVKFGSASGLHDIVLDPDFETNRLVWFTYFAPPEGETPGRWPRAAIAAWNVQTLEERTANPLGTETLARARLSEDGLSLTDMEIMAEGADRRIAFAPDGTVYVSGAERYRFTENDWDVDGGPGPLPMEQRIQFSGRVLRIHTDGTIPADNPFAAGVDPMGAETFSFGHRDPEGIAVHPETGELWLVEHGPMGGDELNIIRPGRDYGWPNVSYGLQYDGNPVGDGESAGTGYEQPIYFWAPSIGPSSLVFYDGEMFPDWKGDLFVGSMPGMHLVRLELDGERVVAEEKLLADMEQRIRDFEVGPDGELYVMTDETAIYRLVAPSDE